MPFDAYHIALGGPFLYFLNPFMPSRLFCLTSLNQSISNRRGVWLVLLLPCFTEKICINANSADPDQTPQSDLGLHCFKMSPLLDARHKWVNS